jgi:hypothetical protein
MTTRDLLLLRAMMWSVSFIYVQLGKGNLLCIYNFDREICHIAYEYVFLVKLTFRFFNDSIKMGFSFLDSLFLNSIVQL